MSFWGTRGDSPPSLKHSLSYAGDTHAPDRRRERRSAVGVGKVGESRLVDAEVAPAG
jgi:hypothetical protein